MDVIDARETSEVLQQTLVLVTHTYTGRDIGMETVHLDLNKLHYMLFKNLRAQLKPCFV